MAASRFIFVGEKRSATAIKRGYTWFNKRLCAKTLTEALKACDLTMERYACINIFQDNGELDHEALGKIRDWHAHGWVIIGLGRTVQRALSAAGVSYRPMVHPAARGRIRQRDTYHAHVATVLQVRGAPPLPAHTD